MPNMAPRINSWNYDGLESSGPAVDAIAVGLEPPEVGEKPNHLAACAIGGESEAARLGCRLRGFTA